MESRLYAFRLGATETYSYGHVCDYLVKISAEQFDFARQGRMIVAGYRDDKCVGVLLSIKDQTRFPELIHGDELRLAIREVEDGRSAFDFNFFAIDPETGAGLYQHYRSSCSISRFSHFLRLRYDDLLQNNGVGDIGTLRSRPAGQRRRSEQMEVSLIYSQESFEELVKQLKSVKYLEFDVVTPKDMSGAFGPLMDYIELERRKVRFKPKTTGRSILSHVTEMVKGTFAQRKFRIEGKGELGEKQLIDFVEPSPQALDKKDVDSLVEDGVLFFSDITRSTYVDTMLEAFSENSLLLGPEISS